MKAVVRDGRGAPRVEDVPPPARRDGWVLVRTHASLVSAGTERAAAEFAGLSLAAKAARRPDLVRQVLTKIRRDGVWETQRAVRTRLDVAEPLGYSAAGIVEDDATGTFPPGALVACAGAGYAAHAERILVPRNLVALVPDGVDAEQAAFATVGSVALHAVRATHAGLGEHVAVLGLGLMGQLAAQLLAAAGCRVHALEPSPARAALARELGCADVAGDAEGLVRLVMEHTNGHGADAVVVAASARDAGPITTATAVARGRGRLVVLGDVPLTLDRRPFYEKELRLVVSRSYGPGRYDRRYEEQGQDYPYEYVRWTLQRNMEAFLALVPRLRLAPLISHRFDIAQANDAYALLLGERSEPYLGIVLRYPEREPLPATLALQPAAAGGRDAAATGSVGVAVIGAGSFARGVLLPAIASLPGVRGTAVVTAKGLSGWDAGRRFGFATCSTDVGAAFENDTQLVVVATRHAAHAGLVVEAVRRGKAVFVEKPLCVSPEQLDAVVAACNEAARPPFVMVGYNRRFAPLVVRLREVLSTAGRPLVLQYRVNAGALGSGSWLLDASEGGGRIVGEACHFLDLLAHLGGAPVRRVTAVRPATLGRPADPETFTATLELANGSVGILVYSADGDAAHPKERLEVVGGGLVAVLDDHRSLTVTRHGRRRRLRGWGRDKGHDAELAATVAAVRAGGDPPIPLGEAVAGMRALFALQQALATGEPVAVPT